MPETLEAQGILPPLPYPSPMTMGGGYGSLPARYVPDIEIYEPDVDKASALPIEHQWRVFQSDINEGVIELTVRGGTVEWDADITVEPITLEAPTVEKVIYCKITVAGETATAAVIEVDEEMPEDTDTEKYWLLAEIYNLFPGGDFYHGIRQIQFEPIRKLADAASINHPWKVTRTDVDTLEYIGGTIYDHNQSIAFVAITVPDGGLAVVEGVVYLRIERDTDSREIVAANVDIAAALPPDDYVNQHFRLAQVVENQPILQLQFQDIKVYEMLVVANGEFKFGNFQMFGEILHDLPS